MPVGNDEKEVGGQTIGREGVAGGPPRDIGLAVKLFRIWLACAQVDKAREEERGKDVKKPVFVAVFAGGQM